MPIANLPLLACCLFAFLKKVTVKIEENESHSNYFVVNFDLDEKARLQVVFLSVGRNGATMHWPNHIVRSSPLTSVQNM
jgi:hypothetical protein